MPIRSLRTKARPKFAPKSTHYREPIAKPQYLPHPWTRATYDAKRHPDPIRCYSTMHWRDRQTDRPIDRPRESLTTIGRCATRATRPSSQITLTDLLLWLNVFDNAPVCRRVTDESWVRAVTWRVSGMRVSRGEYAVTVYRPKLSVTQMLWARLFQMVGAARLKAREDITVLVVSLDNNSWSVERRWREGV